MTTITKEIFAVGKWNGMDFDVPDLQLIALAFHSLGDNHQVPLKLGHNKEQPMKDGHIALGWVSDVYVKDEKLMGEFEDVPEIVKEAFDKKLYRNVSIELDFGVEYKGSFFPLVLSGVALLGADIPAVNTLDDLKAYMGKAYEPRSEKHAEFSKVEKHKDYSAISGNLKEDKHMSDSEEIQTLKAQLAAKDAELSKLVTDKTSLEQERIQDRANFKVLQESEEHRKQVEARGLLVAKLEAMVKAKKIAPFTRDEFLNDYDQAENKAHIEFAVDKLEKTIDANPAYFGAEQARLKANQQKQEDDMDAGSIVVARTREYMVKHGEKSFAIAKTAILQADLELAERYTKGGVSA